jgi:Fe-S cluster biogenesis protein NfuA
MKMGLERGLREKIPEIQEVVQALPSGPTLNEEQIDVVLNGVRPFLQVAGGSIQLDHISGTQHLLLMSRVIVRSLISILQSRLRKGLDGLQPSIWLKMTGSSSSLNSVKLEIAQRLQRHFMLSGLRVEWME